MQSNIFKCILNYENNYFLGFCKTVLTTSNGWNRIVETKPDVELVINDFNIGCYKI